MAQKQKKGKEYQETVKAHYKMIDIHYIRLWILDNNLRLNITISIKKQPSRTKTILVQYDYVYINPIEIIATAKFCGLKISNNLKRIRHIEINVSTAGKRDDIY